MRDIYRGGDVGSIRDGQSFARVFDVSRETLDRLNLYAVALERWQKKINLVSASTIGNIWQRHIADSVQLLDHCGDLKGHWLDLGTGGGAPGLVVALCLADDPSVKVDLVESNAKKCAFLGEIVRQTGANARVINSRIETVADLHPDAVYDIVSARALAPLDRLLEYASRFIDKGARGLFLKGQHVDEELTQATKCWKIDYHRIESLSDPAGVVLVIERAIRV